MLNLSHQRQVDLKQLNFKKKLLENLNSVRKEELEMFHAQVKQPSIFQNSHVNENAHLARGYSSETGETSKHNEQVSFPLNVITIEKSMVQTMLQTEMRK